MKAYSFLPQILALILVQAMLFHAPRAYGQEDSTRSRITLVKNANKAKAKKIERALNKYYISMNFEPGDLRDALQFLSDMTRIKMVFEGDINQVKKVSLHGSNKKLWDLIEELCKRSQTQASIDGDRVVFRAVEKREEGVVTTLDLALKADEITRYSATSADGKLFALSTTNNEICVFEVPSLKLVAHIKNCPDEIHGLKFGPKARNIYAEVDDMNYIYDIKNRTLKSKLKTGHSSSYGLAVTPDGRSLLAFKRLERGKDHADFVMVWNTRTGKRSKLIPLSALEYDLPWRPSFSQNAKYLVYYSKDGQLGIRSMKTMRKLQILKTSHKNICRQFAPRFFDNGKKVLALTGHWTGENAERKLHWKFYIWSVKTGKLMKTIPIKQPDDRGFVLSDNEQEITVLLKKSKTLAVIDLSSGKTVRKEPMSDAWNSAWTKDYIVYPKDKKLYVKKRKSE